MNIKPLSEDLLHISNISKFNVCDPILTCYILPKELLNFTTSVNFP